MRKTINLRTSILIIMILLTGFWRIIVQEEALVSLANFTPVGALALFGGHYFKERWKAYLLPLVTLFASDVILTNVYYAEFSNGILYSGWYWTYFAFLLMVLVGNYIKKVTILNLLFATISTVVIHWIVSDFGVWIGGGMNISTGLPFTKDLSGFINCLVLAIPFMKGMFFGNLIFSTILFGGFELIQYKIPAIRTTY